LGNLAVRVPNVPDKPPHQTGMREMVEKNMITQGQDNGGQAMPQVSVIILTRNRPQYLVKAIQSVLDQTFTDFEIIIVDDASTDETPEVINSFQDRRIVSIRHDVNKGESASRNAGVKMAKGEFIAFLDDDDQWLPQKLELQVGMLQKGNGKLGGVYTGFYKWDIEREQIIGKRVPEKRGDIADDMFVQNWVGTPSTVVVKKKCLKDVGEFDETLVFGPDYDMWIRIAQKYEFDYIAAPLVKYGIHSQQMTTNYRKIILGRERLLEKYREFYSVKRKGQSEFWLNLGVCYCYDGNFHKGMKTFWFGIRNYPHEIRFYYNIFLVLMGSRIFNIVRKM